MERSMYEDLDEIFKEADNPFEAFFAAIIYVMVRLVFRAVEVVTDFGDNT